VKEISKDLPLTVPKLNTNYSKCNTCIFWLPVYYSHVLPLPG